MDDVIVIGGGPSGACCAAALARRGYRVRVIEQEAFPRFHVGESLIPGVMPLFERLGVAEALESEGFLRKYAAEFVLSDGSLQRRYSFADGLHDGGPVAAYEVERSRFDQILLDHAAHQGATVHTRSKVLGCVFESDHSVVEAKDHDGRQHAFAAKYVVDSSGQSSHLAGRQRVRRMNEKLRNVALYTQYRGAARATGQAEGDVTVVLAPVGWWWLIPLRNDITSVGHVAPAASLRGKKPGRELLESELASSVYLRERLAKAEMVRDVGTVSDYSFCTDRTYGDRWLLVGDAAGFLDPVFSTGIYLGVKSAINAAHALDQALTRPASTRRAFKSYDKWFKTVLGIYRAYVEDFYDASFREVLMHPTDKLHLRHAVTSLLAGRLDESGVRWRATLVRNIAKANRTMHLTPRIFGRE